MVVIEGSAIAAGVALTFSIPLAAMNELLMKRHKAQMNKHLPQFKKRVMFECEREKKVAVELPPTQTEEKAKVEVKEKKMVDTTVVVSSPSLPPPPYKSVLRRASPPPPSYDDLIVLVDDPSPIIEEVLPLEEKTALPSPPSRPRVRFAQRA